MAKKYTRKAWCTCKVVVLLIPAAFLPFSLPFPSMLLKLPNHCLNFTFNMKRETRTFYVIVVQRQRKVHEQRDARAKLLLCLSLLLFCLSRCLPNRCCSSFLMISEGYSKQQSSLGRVLCLLDLHIAPIINEPEVFLRHIVCFCFPTFIANTYWTNSAAMVTVEWHLPFKTKQLTCMNFIDGITIQSAYNK